MTLEEIMERTELLIGHLEDLELPEPELLADTYTNYDRAYRLARLVNRLKSKADALKRQTKHDLVDRMDAERVKGSTAEVDGKDVGFSKYEFRSAQVVSLEEFREWAESEDGEAYFEPDPKLRMDIINALVIQRDDDGMDPPPGLDVYREDRISRTEK